ncbi:MAG: T9SS type A sorting domain-containing protein [bacterium]
MKKITFCLVSITFLFVSGSMLAQSFVAPKSHHSAYKTIKPTASQKGTNGIIGQLPFNPYSGNKGVLDDPVLMITRYDLQSNGSSENRIHLYHDGTVGAVTMMSHTDGFSDRGTGTNFFDGTSWGPQPTARIESSKSGWPSYAPWGAGGEIVVTHHMLDGLFVMTRPTKGTGPWTEFILVGPPGAVDISWPRVITNGPNNMYVHIICLTYVNYQGLTPYALLYYRSLDGGVTWDITHRIIEGMTSADYLGFTADMYNWAQPKGDTLAFAFGDSWTDLAVMKSYNNGDDWEKVVVWPCPYNFWAGGTATGTFLACDGTVAVALDQYGKAHVASGVMYSSGDETGAKFWVPKSDGMLYWNETMPQLPEVLDWDSLYANGNLIGWVTDTNVFYVEDSQIAYYYNSMTSQPTICVDDDDYVFVTWSGMTMNTDPDNYLLRHIYSRGSGDYGNTWTMSLIDLTSDFLYSWSECVYPSVSFTSDDKLYIVFQEDDYAGVSLNTTGQGQHFVTQNNIRFLNPTKMSILVPVAVNQIEENSFRVSQNYPNPVSGKAFVKVNLTQSGTLGMEVSNLMGQTIMNLSKGTCSAGNYELEIGTRNLTPGVYFYTVTFNKERVTKKMVVE